MADAFHLQRANRWYVWSVIILGSAAALEAAWRLAIAPVSSQWWLLIALIVLSSSIVVKLPLVSATMSVSEAFLFTAVLLFGPAPGTIAAVVDGLVISLRLQRPKSNVIRLLFNMTAPAVAIWPAAHLFTFLAPSAARGHVTDVLPALAVFATVYFLLNTWLVVFAIAGETGASPSTLWREHFAAVSLNYLVGASVALLFVGLGKEVTLWAVLSIVPLLMISYLTVKTTLTRVEDTHRHLEELHALHHSTIETLAMAIDAKDQITHGHIRRVQTDAVALARTLGIEGVELQAIEAAALLHDMGKLSVPEHILNKPGKLTPEELDIMQHHASHGADMLAAIKFPYPVVPIVRHHHEQWNGLGYPSRLVGTDIPIGARILSVVDCFDALTSDRPYRPKLPDAEALAILRDGRGTKYDPRVVDGFIEIYPDAVARRRAASSAFADVARQASSGETRLRPAMAGGDSARQSDLHPDLFAALETLTACLTLLPPASLTVVYSHERRTDSLLAIYARGQAAGLIVGKRILVGKQIGGWVAATQRSMLNADAALDLGEIARQVTPPIESCLSVPLVQDETLFGVISLYATRATEWSDDHRRVVETVSRQLASTMKRCADQSTSASRMAASGSFQPVVH